MKQYNVIFKGYRRDCNKSTLPTYSEIYMVHRCVYHSRDIMQNNLPPHKDSAKSSDKFCRQSGIEALRIVSMFLVLLVHALFFSLGRPTHLDLENHSLEMICRTELEAISLVCVNVFVLISGWFGITVKWKGLFKFIYQWLFWALLISLFFAIAIGGVSFNEIRLLIGSYQYYWFLYAYLFLYILSPVLNAFVESNSSGEVKKFLWLYWIFMFFFGWLEQLNYIQYGLSPILFIGLYVTARYIKRISPRWANKSWTMDFCLYILFSTLSACFMIAVVLFDKDVHYVDKAYGMFMSYVNPLTVVSSIYLLLAFSKFRFRSRIINRVAASAFAVYLLQCNYGIFEPYFKKYVVLIHDQFDGATYPLVTLLYLKSIYLVAFFIDQLRIFTFSKLIDYVKAFNNGRIKNS